MRLVNSYASPYVREKKNGDFSDNKISSERKLIPGGRAQSRRLPSGGKNLESLKRVSQTLKQLLRIHFEHPLSVTVEKKGGEKKKRKKEADRTVRYNREGKIRFSVYYIQV